MKIIIAQLSFFDFGDYPSKNIMFKTFYIYFIISRHNEDIINLDYEIAVLKKKVEELEKERHDD